MPGDRLYPDDSSCVPGEVGESGTRPGNGRMHVLCVGHHPFAKLLAVPERQVAGATSEVMISISNDVQTILTQYSSEEDETEVKVSV